MISTAVLSWFMDLVSWAVGLFPTFSLPSSLEPSGMLSLVQPLAVALGAADPYLDAAVLVVASVAVLAAFVVAFGIKGVRIILSLGTGGGGSAA
jgi:hypothetical protein